MLSRQADVLCQVIQVVDKCIEGCAAVVTACGSTFEFRYGNFEALQLLRAGLFERSIGRVSLGKYLVTCVAKVPPQLLVSRPWGTSDGTPLLLQVFGTLNCRVDRFVIEVFGNGGGLSPRRVDNRLLGGNVFVPHTFDFVMQGVLQRLESFFYWLERFAFAGPVAMPFLARAAQNVFSCLDVGVLPVGLRQIGLQLFAELDAGCKILLSNLSLFRKVGFTRLESLVGKIIELLLLSDVFGTDRATECTPLFTQVFKPCCLIRRRYGVVRELFDCTQKFLTFRFCGKFLPVAKFREPGAEIGKRCIVFADAGFL